MCNHTYILQLFIRLPLTFGRPSHFPVKIREGWEVLTFTIPAGVAFPASLLINYSGFPTFGTQVTDLHG